MRAPVSRRLYHGSVPTLPYLIGLTGGIACGKSAVGQLLRRLGADYVDADHVVHELLGPGGAAVGPILARFGEGVRVPHGGIDRKALGAIVFRDTTALRELEAIVHPLVRPEIRRRIAAATAAVVVVDAIRLIESGLADECDSVWVVTCPPEEQRRRLVELRGLTAEEADARVAAQPPQASRLARADVVIENAGSLDDLERQVREAWSVRRGGWSVESGA